MYALQITKLHTEVRKDYNRFMKVACTKAFDTLCTIKNSVDDEYPEWADMTKDNKEDLAKTKEWHASGDAHKNYLGAKTFKMIMGSAKTFKHFANDEDDEEYRDMLRAADRFEQGRIVSFSNARHLKTIVSSPLWLLEFVSVKFRFSSIGGPKPFGFFL